MSAVQPLAQPPANDMGMMAQSNTTMLLMNPLAMEQLYRFAEIMASGVATVPKHLQGKPSDCLAIVMQAIRWGMDPFIVGQKTHLVNGTLGYEAQLVNAVLQSSGAIVGRFHYEYRGEGNTLECRVGAVPAGESALVWNEWLKISDVTTKNSPLWKTNPKQQMGYLQVKNWGRAIKPGAIMGIYTVDELEQSPQSIKDINPIPDATATEQKGSGVKGSLKNKPKASEQTAQAEQQHQTAAQQHNAGSPNFDDVETTAHTFSPEAQKFADSLIDCYEGEHFSEWKKAVQAKFPANSADFVELVNTYNNRVAFLKTQNQGA